MAPSPYSRDQMIPIGYNLYPDGEHSPLYWTRNGLMSPSGNKSTTLRLRSPKDIGALVKQRRKSLGLTQLEAADQAGVGRRFLIELEEGKPTTQLGKTIHVLSMLGVTLTGFVEQ